MRCTHHHFGAGHRLLLAGAGEANWVSDNFGRDWTRYPGPGERSCASLPHRAGNWAGHRSCAAAALGCLAWPHLRQQFEWVSDMLRHKWMPTHPRSSPYFVLLERMVQALSLQPRARLGLWPEQVG